MLSLADHESSQRNSTSDDDYFNPLATQLSNQDELNDLVRDLALTKLSSELLAFGLDEKNLLSPGTNITYYRERDVYFLPFLLFIKIVYTVVMLKACLRTYDPNQWWVFIDSSKRSLKVVLLDNGNKFGYIPIGHPVK